MRVRTYEPPINTDANGDGSLWVWIPKEYSWKLCSFNCVKEFDKWLPYDSIIYPDA